MNSTMILKAAAIAVLEMESERVNQDRGEPYCPIANPGQFDPRIVALAYAVHLPPLDDIDKAISEINDLQADHIVFMDGSSMTGPEAWKKALDVCVGILTKLKAKAAVPKESCDTVSQNHIKGD